MPPPRIPPNIPMIVTLIFSVIPLCFAYIVSNSDYDSECSNSFSITYWIKVYDIVLPCMFIVLAIQSEKQRQSGLNEGNGVGCDTLLLRLILFLVSLSFNLAWSIIYGLKSSHCHNISSELNSFLIASFVFNWLNQTFGCGLRVMNCME